MRPPHFPRSPSREGRLTAAEHRVGAVVLAAGASARLGRPKQMVMHEGEPLVRRAARAARDAGAEPVVVVVGAHADVVASALDGLAGVHTVLHAGWRNGLATSLAAGLGALRAHVAGGAAPLDGALITLCDQPLVDAAALRRLLAAFDASHAVVAAEYAGTVGVPAVIGRAHWAAVQALAGDAGAGRWLRAYPTLVTTIPLPEAAQDVDTPADVARLATPAA